MRKLKVKMLAFANASQDIFDYGLSILEQYVPQNTFEFTHTNPDVLFFITGGSEKAAVEIMKHQQRIVLWSHAGDNSNASATEVKARLNTDGKNSLLLDVDDAHFPAHAKYLQQVIAGFESMKNQQLGLLGEVSEWLVASDISAPLLKSKFGVDLVPVSWDALPSYEKCAPSEKFNAHFNVDQQPELIKASRVHQLMEKTIRDNHLDAITVECFPLVKEQSVTACLSLSLLNDENIPAGCEGDLTSIIGMMFIKSLTNQIPWMANTVKVTDTRAKFAHCTVPTKMVNNFTIPTHYETNLGTAIQGDVSAEILTVFRFDNQLENVFISVCRVAERPKSNNACRTQIIAEMPEEDLKSLQNYPLGNHHLFFEGDYRELLNVAVKWLGLDVVNG